MRHSAGRSLVAGVGLLAVVTGVPLVCQGRVFLNLGRWLFPALAEGVAGGKVIYEANFRINGARARVGVLECPMGAGSLARTMGVEMSGATAGLVAGEPVRIWEQAGEARHMRWVAVQPAGRTGCVLFGIEQEAKQAGAVGMAEFGSAVPGLSALPGARTTFAAVNENTRTALTVVRARGAAESLAASVEAGLRQQGWQPALTRARAAGCGIFVRGGEVCCLWIRSGESPGDCLVAILHKRPI